MRRGPLVVALAAAAVAILVLIVLVFPKISQVNKQQKALSDAQQQEQQLKAQLGTLRAARRQAAQVQRELNRLETQIPPTADLPGMIRLLQSAADRSAVDFMSVSPGQPAVGANTQVSVIPTEITATGTFFSVDEFLFHLETLSRAIKVTQISVAPSTLPQLTLSISTEVYTTDTSSGPGSLPGPTGATTTTTPTPAPSPSGG